MKSSSSSSRNKENVIWYEDVLIPLDRNWTNNFLFISLNIYLNYYKLLTDLDTEMDDENAAVMHAQEGMRVTLTHVKIQHLYYYRAAMIHLDPYPCLQRFHSYHHYLNLKNRYKHLEVIILKVSTVIFWKWNEKSKKPKACIGIMIRQGAILFC